MSLNDQELKKLEDWFRSKKVNLTCPSCGHNDWSAGGIVVAPTFRQGIVIGGPAIPMVQLICKYCAYINFYAAVPIGLMEAKKEQEALTEKSSDKD